MKLLTKTLTSLVLGCSLLSMVAFRANAASVIVDNTSAWTGWMNWYTLVGGNSPGTSAGGSGWGTADLRGVISGPTLTLSPNTSTWNPADSYWVNAGQPNKWMEANFYVDAGTAFAGTSLTFSGDTVANSLTPPYASVAVIKEFAPGYNWVGMTTASLVGGSPFAVTRAIGAGNIAQYGFMTTGPNADPATVGNFGFASITVVPEPATAVLVGMGFLGLLLRRPRRG